MALTLAEILSNLPILGASAVGGSGASNCLPVLNNSGQLDASLFANSVAHIFLPADTTARLALAAEPGDIALQTNDNNTYILSASPASTSGNWLLLGTGTSVPYDNTGTTLISTNVGAAITELWTNSLIINDTRSVTVTNPNITFGGTAPFAVTHSVLVTNLNADLLDGQHGGYYQDASHLSAGVLPTGRLTGTYDINISGQAASSLVAATATQASVASSCTGNAATATLASAAQACTGNAATSTTATNLLDGTSTPRSGAYYQNPANLTGGYIPSAVFNATSHGALSGGTLHAVANGTTAGFMSAAMFSKLDGIEAGSTAPLDAYAAVTISGVAALTAPTPTASLNFVPGGSGLLSITSDGSSLTFDVTLGGISHHALGHLTDYDDHPQYLTASSAYSTRTVTAVHFYNPTAVGPPFVLESGGTMGNAFGQLVTGLNADLLDGQHGAYYQDASHLTTGTLDIARLGGGPTFDTVTIGTALITSDAGTRLTDKAYVDALIYRGTITPTSPITKIWIDITVPASPTVKVYDTVTSAWVAIA